MKKVALSLSFLLCAFFSFAQFPNRTEISNVKTIYVPLGALAPGLSLMIPVIDTLNNLATPYRGALTVRPQDSLLYMSDGVNWHPFVSSTNGWIVDSIYVERPIAVKIGTSGVSLGKQVIYFLKESGLIAGGIPVSTGCRTLLMPPSIYNINFNQYTSLATALTIDTSHATLNRTDRIVGDTFGIISVIKGTPSSLGLAPPYNPSSQFSLALISIPAASTCTPPSSSIKVVYDQAVGVAGGEYDTSRVGAIAVNFNNTDNPYHLTKAAFISTYRDSTQLVFTNTGLQDTVTSTSILVLPTYLNVPLVNPVQVEFFLGTTSVSNNTVINSYFNPLDTGQYQVAAIPFTAFSFSSNFFNKIVFTFRGYDTSGAAGLYFDWIQIQKGITFTSPGLTLTTNTSTTASTLINNVLNIPPAWSIIGNAGTTSSNSIGTTDTNPLLFKVNSTNYGSIGNSSNTFLGYLTGNAITSATNSTAFGYNALILATSGVSNTAIGSFSLAANTTGTRNTGIGVSSLGSNTIGEDNVGLGGFALGRNISGLYNTAAGRLALQFVTTGEDNSALGYDAGRGITTGINNTLVGKNVRWDNNGSGNTMIGRGAGYHSTGDSNVFIGNFAGYNATGTQKLYISNSDTETPLIYGEFATPALTFGGTITLRNAPPSGASTDSVLVRNATTGVVNMRNRASLITAGNGITDSSGKFILSGSAYKNIDIAMAGNQFSLTNAVGGSFATLNVTGLDGYGVFSSTTSGSAFRGSTTSGLPMVLTTAPTSTSTIVPVLYLERGSSGVGANGIGGSIQFGIHTASSNYVVANTLVSKWTDAVQLTRTSQFDLTGINSAVTETFANFQTGGIVRVNNLADTLSTKAYARSLSSGGGWGTTGTIATLTGASTLDLGGNSFVFVDNGNNLLIVDPTNANPTGFSAFDNTGGDNGADYQAVANSTQGKFNITAYFDGGTKTTSIIGTTESGVSELEYTADTHTFLNKVILATTQTPASAAATGTIGTIAWDANFIYICVGTDTWKRIGIVTW